MAGKRLRVSLHVPYMILGGFVSLTIWANTRLNRRKGWCFRNARCALLYDQQYMGALRAPIHKPIIFPEWRLIAWDAYTFILSYAFAFHYKLDGACCWKRDGLP